jgi:hypothetical protein
VARDITEGRPTRAVAVDIGLTTATLWQNTGVQYDFALAGLPFLAAIDDEHPYERSTAQFRKQQFDSQRDPGEQSLSNWWLRSQMSFHAGEGIVYYDPLSNPYSTTIATNSYRVKESYGVDMWTPGEVTLLKDVASEHITTHDVDASTLMPGQIMRTIKYGDTDGFLLLDGYDINRFDGTGIDAHWVDYSAGTADKVYAMCDDGQFAYWITNDTVSGKLEMDKKALTAASTTAPSVMFTKTGTTVNRAVMEYVKHRIVVAVNNVISTVPTNATTSSSLTDIYTHPNTSYTFTSITESGTAVYVSGYLGSRSTIFRINSDNTGAMPALTAAVVAAEMPEGELVFKIYTYLGYMMIGTSKGIRVASIDATGSLTYGPLIVHTSQPCYDFCARDTYVWCATGVNGEPGVIRIDLSTEIETLRFPYAHDIHLDNVEDKITTACAFIGNSDRKAFVTAATRADTLVTNKALTSNVATLTMSSVHGLAVGDKVWVEGVGAPFDSGSPYTGETVLSVPTTTTFTYSRTTSNVTSAVVTSSAAKVYKVGAVYLEETTKLRPSGYIETGLIRYNTLEPKNFKRVIGRGSFTYGSMSLQTRSQEGTLYDLISYDSIVGAPEVTITSPAGAQDSMGLRFNLFRDATDDTKGPTFKGYQLKAVPATPRNRIITVPLLNFDSETDKYNQTVGYEGRAIDRLAALENAEANGDIVTWQDFRNNEIAQCLIEEVKFRQVTPPDKRLTGYGGIITLTIRTV